MRFPFRHSRIECALLLGALAIGRTGRTAEAPELTIQIVGTEHPSSFPKRIWVHVHNPAYTALSLVDLVASSELLIDGKPSRRTTARFDGPPGIPPVGDWEGCLPIEDYTPPMTPGRHKVSVRMGGAQSDETTVRWTAPIDWRKGTMKTRLREVRELASAMKKGLPKSCVEQWLTMKDGAVQRMHGVRYYLEPQIKVVVPYSQAGEAGHADEAVNGPVQVYQERRWE
jgi:hypothetical protein